MMAVSIPQEWPSQDFSQERLLTLWQSSHDDVFWRHDVDYNLSCARQMAYLENQNGIKSTYYFRSIGEDYDTSSDEFVGTVEFCRSLGHELGFHIDLMLEREAYVPAMYVRRQFEIQSRFVRKYISGARVSFHAPPRSALWRDYVGLEHAMGSRWEGKYIADSRGMFRLSPEAFLSSRIAVQINLHAEWWFLPAEEASAMREREAVKP
jgi:hypothetical protein